MSGQTTGSNAGAPASGAADAGAGASGADTQAQATQQTVQTSNVVVGNQQFESSFDYSKTADPQIKEIAAGNEAFAKLIPEAYSKEKWVQNVLKSPDKSHVSEFFSQFADLQTKLGQPKTEIKVPTDQSTPEEVQAFYKLLGVPDSVDDYKLESAKFEDADKEIGAFLTNSRPDAFMSEIKAAAKTLGVNPKQLQGLLAAHDSAFIKHNRAAIEQFAKAEQDDAIDFDAQFTQMFGDRKTSVIAEGRKMMDAIIPANSPARVWLARQSNETLAGVAAVLDAFRQRYISEDSGLRSGSQQVASSANPREEAQKLMATDAYRNPNHLEHESTRRRVRELYQQAESLGQLGKK